MSVAASHERLAGREQAVRVAGDRRFEQRPPGGCGSLRGDRKVLVGKGRDVVLRDSRPGRTRNLMVWDGSRRHSSRIRAGILDTSTIRACGVATMVAVPSAT